MHEAPATGVSARRPQSVGRIARDLDLTETALRRWVEKAECGSVAKLPIDEDERVELGRLREEVRVLRMERDILKKAAAFFAKESK